jgi:CarD family transcriptional regulator
MFEVGDVVVHPIRGAGVVTDIKELQRRGDSKQYYRIRLLTHARTSLMIPVKGATAKGLRRAIKEYRLNRVWHVLCSNPKKLPTDYEARHELLEHKLRSGDLLQVAEATRDLTWRRQEQNGLTWGDRQAYRRGIKLLAGEIAAAQGTGVLDAEAEVRARLWGRLSPKVARWSRHRRV